MPHLIRDPVHHTITLSRHELEVVDHPLFQRLRNIKQTAFLYKVFPGATHDRFSHALGVMHTAGLIFKHAAAEFIENYGRKALLPEQEDYLLRVIRLAALLHDVGHGPFSHSLESVASLGRPIYPNRGDLLSAGRIPDHWLNHRILNSRKTFLKEKTHHEDFSIAIIAMMADEDGLLGGIKAQDIAALLCDWVEHSDDFMKMVKLGPTGKWDARPVLKSIVSGEMDADRMDYLQRDSHYTGCPFGSFDKEMLLENLLWRPDPENPKSLRVCVRRKALHALEDFLLSRYHMFLQLYSHKTVVSFDVILENAIAELPDFTIAPDLTSYVTWSDEWLLRKILENRSSRWGEHIRDRKPLKHLFTVREEDQKSFKKFMSAYETSLGTTAWFPTLKNRVKAANAPKLWWRQATAYLTKEARGKFPILIEDRKQLVPFEKVSLLLRSDYVRRVDVMHVYCLREEYSKVVPWLLSQEIPESILAKPTRLVH